MTARPSPLRRRNRPAAFDLHVATPAHPRRVRPRDKNRKCVHVTCAEKNARSRRRQPSWASTRNRRDIIGDTACVIVIAYVLSRRLRRYNRKHVRVPALGCLDFSRRRSTRTRFISSTPTDAFCDVFFPLRRLFTETTRGNESRMHS